MASEKGDASKVDPSNVIGVKYDDIPEEDRQAFEAKLKQQEEEARKNLLSCFGRTQNEVVKKAEFIIPPFQSTSSTTNVSISDSQKFTQEMLLTLTDRVDKLDKGKVVSHAYSTLW